MITLGPIIGKVDENSARILIEIDQEIELTIELKEIDSRTNQTMIIKHLCNPKYPKVFKFLGLKSQTRYEVMIQNDIEFKNPELKDLKSRFRTTSKIGKTPDKFNIAFVSCYSSNYYKTLKKPEFSLWNNLSKKVEAEG